MWIMKKTIIYSLMIISLLFSGCSDTWNDHYVDNHEKETGLTVMELIKEDPELSTFSRMIEIAGYSDLLNSSQTFTVWAPVNSALTEVDLSDKEEVARTISNHLARFNNSTATPPTEGVKMINGKMHYFGQDGLSFGDMKILSGDIIARNGLLHKIEEMIPYSYNFREYMETHANTTLIARFLSRFDEMIYQSQIPGTAESLSTDTTLVSYNRLLQYPELGLGVIESEDSLFTMIVPTDLAWQKAYDEISPYFKTYNPDPAKADSIQEVQTSLAIVSDLIFRTGLDNPLSMDSIISTSGSVIKSPSSYFRGMEEMEASNGRLFLANALNINKKETFCKPIYIESEEQSGRTPAAGTTVYTRNVSTDNKFANEISGQRYIEVSPTSSSRQPGITFQIPNILAGEYDIYAVFVPASVSDPSNVNDSTRVQFAVMYQGENGRTQTSSFNSSDFTTSGDEVTTICVTRNFKFPVANYYDRIWLMDPLNSENDRNITTSIYISTNVNNSEFNENKFSRSFRIDRVYLVPSEN